MEKGVTRAGECEQVWRRCKGGKWVRRGYLRAVNSSKSFFFIGKAERFDCNSWWLHDDDDA